MDDPWADDAAFIGKVTAGATHEIRNVLSIIKESAGLMGDLLDMNQDSSFAHEEKFRRMIENIGVQVERGANISKELNNLAHTPDQRLKTVDIKAVLKSQSTLYERFCRQKQISMKLESNDQETNLETDPVRFHKLIGTVVDVLLERISSPGTMILKTELIDESITINFSVTNTDGSAQPLVETGDLSNAFDMAKGLGSSLGFSLDLNSQQGYARLILTQNMPGTN